MFCATYHAVCVLPTCHVVCFLCHLSRCLCSGPSATLSMSYPLVTLSVSYAICHAVCVLGHLPRCLCPTHLSRCLFPMPFVSLSVFWAIWHAVYVLPTCHAVCTLPPVIPYLSCTACHTVPPCHTVSFTTGHAVLNPAMLWMS